MDSIKLRLFPGKDTVRLNRISDDRISAEVSGRQAIHFSFQGGTLSIQGDEPDMLTARQLERIQCWIRLYITG